MQSFDVFFDDSPNKLLKKNQVTGDLKRHDANVTIMIILLQVNWYEWIFDLLIHCYIQRIIIWTTALNFVASTIILNKTKQNEI